MYVSEEKHGTVAKVANHPDWLRPVFPDKPLHQIALTFSGGGFRAASFALGTLSLFDVVKTREGSLLKRVTYIASASGGTITNACYALHTKQGGAFSKFYSELRGFMQGTALLEKALTLLNDDKSWQHQPKHRNLINAFARVYDTVIYKEARLGALETAQGASTHLQEVCFNATEFYSGLPFRQQAKMQMDGKADMHFFYGNFKVHQKGIAPAKFKLADILAASSCFPGGFEPIIYPQDFVATRELAAVQHELEMIQVTGTQKETKFREKKTVGLMDGGITDNIALESVMLADMRRINRETDFERFGLIFPCDVGSGLIEFYNMARPDTHNWWSNLSVRTIQWMLLAGALLGLGLTVLGSVKGWTLLTVPSAMLFALCGVVVTALYWIINKLNTQNSKANLDIPFPATIVNTLKDYLLRSPFYVLWNLVKSRFDSMIILNTDLFLRRVRQLLYNDVYEAPRWKNRRKSNHIYDLSRSNAIEREKDDKAFPYLKPSAKVEEVAGNAFAMGTTLWFTADDESAKRPADLIACGQFTTCRNLLLYIERLQLEPDYAMLEPGIKAEVVDIKMQLKDLWNRFQTDPGFMV